MLFTCPGNAEYLSAAILDPETIYQKVTDDFIGKLLQFINLISNKITTRLL
jgi:hypothetical protein